MDSVLVGAALHHMAWLSPYYIVMAYDAEVVVDGIARPKLDERPLIIFPLFLLKKHVVFFYAGRKRRVVGEKSIKALLALKSSTAGGTGGKASAGCKGRAARRGAGQERMRMHVHVLCVGGVDSGKQAIVTKRRS